MERVIETYEDGQLVESRVVEAPDVADPLDVAAIRAKLATATTTAKLRDVLGDVLDALDQQP